MLIVALVLAVVGLAALVTAVVTGNELIAWVCIAASVIGVLLLIIDAIRERQGRDRPAEAADGAAAAAPVPAAQTVDETYETFDAEYPEPDESEADESEADESEADESEADEPEADEPEADEPEADEPEAGGQDAPAEDGADPDRSQS